MSIRSGLLPRAESLFNFARKGSKEHIEPVTVEPKRRSFEFWETQKETSFDISHDTSFEQTQIQIHIQENKEKLQNKEQNNHKDQNKEQSDDSHEDKELHDPEMTDDSSSVFTENEVKVNFLFFQI